MEPSVEVGKYRDDRSLEGKFTKLRLLSTPSPAMNLHSSSVQQHYRK